jgi:hypothetical protein
MKTGPSQRIIEYVAQKDIPVKESEAKSGSPLLRRVERRSARQRSVMERRLRVSRVLSVWGWVFIFRVALL